MEIIMRFIFTILIATLFISTLLAQDDTQRRHEQIQFLNSWPKGVPYIEGLRLYTPTKFTQYLSISDGADSDVPWSINQDDHLFNRANPNKHFPYHVPGGLDEVDGISHRTAIMIPKGKKIVVWSERVTVPSAERKLPQIRWTFPDGTVFVDQLLNDKGQCFELRMREKRDGQWISRAYRPAVKGGTHEHYTSKHNVVTFESPTLEYQLRRITYPIENPEFAQTSVVNDGYLIPKNYMGPGISCNECHKHSGRSDQYGIAVRGGGDGDFSFSPLIPGTHHPDVNTWPLEIYGR